MLLFKACPRCRGGDLVVEREDYGAVAICLQCGYIADLYAVRRRLAQPATVRATAEREQAPAA